MKFNQKIASDIKTNKVCSILDPIEIGHFYIYRFFAISFEIKLHIS